MNESPFAPPSVPLVQIEAALEPVHHILLSLWAMTANEAVDDASAERVAITPWLAQAAARLTPEQQQFNRLFFAVFGSALLPEEAYPDFDSYLAAWAGQPIELLQSRLEQAAQAAPEAALAPATAALLADPLALRQKIVDHLRTLWADLLAAEWQRQTPFMVSMTRSINELIFSQPRWQAVNAFDALRFLLQTEPTDPQLAQLAGVQRLVLVWSPFLLATCQRFGSHDTLWVVRQFDPQLMRRDPLSRAEVLRPLTALADDTRLRLLELLTEQGEQRAQELIAQLESSQGNISRHLKQLVSASLVRERRAGDANKRYAMNDVGIRRVLFLLRQLLSRENAQSVAQQQATATRLEQVRANASPVLHDFLDEHGRITRWSSKLKDQEAMMAYVLEKFEPERSYSEMEVNEMIQRWYLDADFVLLRRSMVDAGLLHRTKDGFRYWRQ
jgi:DNA-binding transcriptional ArsR family regulator